MSKLPSVSAVDGLGMTIGRVMGEGVDVSHGPILYLEDISVSFDGFKALDKLTLTVDAGELRCVIGPNGAGKTTMMDVITGKTQPDSGTAFFGQTIDLTRLTEPEIAQAASLCFRELPERARALALGVQHANHVHPAFFKSGARRAQIGFGRIQRRLSRRQFFLIMGEGFERVGDLHESREHRLAVARERGVRFGFGAALVSAQLPAVKERRGQARADEPSRRTALEQIGGCQRRLRQRCGQGHARIERGRRHANIGERSVQFGLGR